MLYKHHHSIVRGGGGSQFDAKPDLKLDFETIPVITPNDNSININGVKTRINFSSNLKKYPFITLTPSKSIVMPFQICYQENDIVTSIFLTNTNGHEYNYNSVLILNFYSFRTRISQNEYAYTYKFGLASRPAKRIELSELKMHISGIPNSEFNDDVLYINLGINSGFGNLFNSAERIGYILDTLEDIGHIAIDKCLNADNILDVHRLSGDSIKPCKDNNDIYHYYYKRGESEMITVYNQSIDDFKNMSDSIIEAIENDIGNFMHSTCYNDIINIHIKTLKLHDIKSQYDFTDSIRIINST